MVTCSNFAAGLLFVLHQLHSIAVRMQLDGYGGAKREQSMLDILCESKRPKTKSKQI